MKNKKGAGHPIGNAIMGVIGGLAAIFIAKGFDMSIIARIFIGILTGVASFAIASAVPEKG